MKRSRYFDAQGRVFEQEESSATGNPKFTVRFSRAVVDNTARLAFPDAEIIDLYVTRKLKRLKMSIVVISILFKPGNRVARVVAEVVRHA